MSPAARATPSAAPAPAAPASFPVVRIGWQNPSADEQDSAHYELGADGAFTKTSVRSNGGGGGTRELCAGALPAAEATTWIAKVRAAATLSQPPRRPRHPYEPGFEDHDAFDVELATGPETVTYAAPKTVFPALDALLGRMAAGARCRTERYGH